MLSNYVKITLRNLFKHRTTTAIHVLGLTVGLTTCLLIALFVRYEWNYDRDIPQADQIYRVSMVIKTGSEVEKSGITPYPLADALRLEFPNWPTIGSVHADENTVVRVTPGKLFNQDRVLFAEPSMFKLFGLQMVVGNADVLLSRPNQVILSETLAKIYFGTASPLGKTLRLGDKTEVEVGGIMRDMPEQFHLSAPMVVSYKTLKGYFPYPLDHWGLSSAGSVYVRLPDGQTPNRYLAQLGKILPKYYTSEQDRGSTRELILQPLTDIHFNPAFGGSEYVPAMATTYLWVFGIIGLFILLIACVNFVNMSTARATTRAKEVGVRKSIGATSGQLTGQFLSEAFCLTFASVLFTLGLTYALLPHLNNFLQKQVLFDGLFIVGLLLGLGFFTTLVAGLYPAIFMARFEPIRALKARMVVQPGWATLGRVRLRQSLVVFQFAVSLVLGVGVVVIYQQMKLFREKDLGFDRSAIVTINTPNLRKTMPALYPQLTQLAGVQQVSFGLGAPTSENKFGTGMLPNPSRPNEKVNVEIKPADANYATTYGLKLLAGRFFSYADTLAISASIPREKRQYVFVVNEATVKALGYARPEKALGHEIQIGLNDIRAKIAGVVGDFHATSLHEEIKPVVMLNFPQIYQMVGIRLQSGNPTATLTAIEKILKQRYPDTLFEPQFLDATLQRQYDDENRQFALLRVFAGLALLICCLGLWGLATFTIEQRTKEIGVRKVLGASVGSLVALLSQDFLKLVLIALVIASPIAWYVMTEWLQDFAYKVAIDWWVFVLVGGLGLLIALLTVSFQSVRAALMNPVKSLRSE